MKPLRVAYLTSLYPATSHTFIRREVAALRRLGVDVHTFSVRPAQLSDTAGADDRAEAESTSTLLKDSARSYVGAHLRALFARPGPYFSTFSLAMRHRAPGMSGLMRSFAHFAEAILLARELERRSITHLHNHVANSAATVGLLATRFLRCCWSFVIHGPSETDYPAGYLLGEKARFADLVVCAHWFGASQGMRLVPYEHWKKFHVVRCGVNMSALPDVATYQRDPNQIICVGRLAADKAQAGLFEAFVEVRRNFPDVRLKLVGGGQDRDQLEALACELGISDAVIFTGPLPEPDTLREIASSGMMVLPSFWEGLPVVLMEALSLGVPAITSRIAGVPELIEHGVNGLLFTPANWTELGEEIARLLGDPELRAKFAAKGRRAVETEFDVDISAARLRRLFEALPSANGA